MIRAVLVSVISFVVVVEFVTFVLFGAFSEGVSLGERITGMLKPTVRFVR